MKQNIQWRIKRGNFSSKKRGKNQNQWNRSPNFWTYERKKRRKRRHSWIFPPKNGALDPLLKKSKSFKFYQITWYLSVSMSPKLFFSTGIVGCNKTGTFQATLGTPELILKYSNWRDPKYIHEEPEALESILFLDFKKTFLNNLIFNTHSYYSLVLRNS